MGTGESNGASAAGTEGYRARRVAEGVHPGSYHAIDGLTVSSIGLGTYLGPATDQADHEYADALCRAVELGANFVDSAINYRHQRSERAIGAGLRRVFASGTVGREAVVVATKGGYIAYDGAPSADPGLWIHQQVVAAGLAGPADVTAGCHCMTPAYLSDQIEKSRANLGLETIDLYYLHNPETQLDEVDRKEFTRRLRAAFAGLEAAVSEGRLRAYGVATWNGFRVAPSEPGYLSIAEVVETAREAAGGRDHHFRVVQMPFNLTLSEALTLANQQVGDRVLTMAEAAPRLGVALVASASILQGRLAARSPGGTADALPDLRTNAQRAIQLARSAGGVASVLVGMRRTAHVEENLEVARLAPLPPEQARALISSPGA